MKYQGGKHRQAAVIASALNHAVFCLRNGNLKNNGGSSKLIDILQPFCGALSIETEVFKNVATKYAYLVDTRLCSSDLSAPVIEMWRYFLGLSADDLKAQLPKSWSKQQHDETRQFMKLNCENSNPVHTWLMHAHSFGGGWCNSYGDNGSGRRKLLDEQTDALLRKHKVLRPSVINRQLIVRNYDYKEVLNTAHWSSDHDYVVYCDPPYKTSRPTKEAHQVDAAQFDHDVFWQTVRELSEMGTIVLVTEYNAPADFVAIHTWANSGSTLSNKRVNQLSVTNEGLFIHQSLAHLFNSWKLTK